MRTVRLWFSKTGNARYISHLDLNRFMARLLRRAGVPIWYTEGFNPRPHTVFSLSLPLGVEGLNEALDIRLEDDTFDVSSIPELLNAKTVPGIVFNAISEPVHKPSEIGLASYTVTSLVLSDEMANRAGELLINGPLSYQKKTKNGQLKSIDVTSNISSLNITNDGGVFKADLTLPAGEALNISPVSLLTVLCEKTVIPAGLFICARTSLMLPNGEKYS